MKLLYAQGACSLSVHICLEQIGKNYEAQMVSIKDKGPELLDYNPLGYVPVLILDSGEIKTEAIAILQYLAEKNPMAGLIADSGSAEWSECLQWLSYTSSEIHQKIGPLFHKDKLAPDFLKEVQGKVDERMTKMDKHLTDKKFLVGDDFSVADMYALAILRIATHVGIKFAKYPALQKYQDMLGKIPSVKKIIELETQAGKAQKTA